MRHYRWATLLGVLTQLAGQASASPVDMAPSDIAQNTNDPSAEDAVNAIADVPSVGATDIVRQLDYFVVSQRVTHFLPLLSRDSGIRIEMTESVRGDLSKIRLRGSPEDVIAEISSRLNLDWFDFNGVYYLSSKAESTTRLIRLGETSLVAAREALTEAGLNYDRFAFRTASGGSAIAISGPPKLLGMSEALIESLPTFATPIAAASRIVVRRGVHISAEPVSNSHSSSSDANPSDAIDSKEGG